MWMDVEPGRCPEVGLDINCSENSRLSGCWFLCYVQKAQYKLWFLHPVVKHIIKNKQNTPSNVTKVKLSHYRPGQTLGVPGG
jgi:hypothetical protein